MAYVGFDLDETLGRFSVAHYHTLFLQPHTAMYGGVWSGLYGSGYVREPIPLSASLKSQLDTAFDLFARCVAEKEKQDPPLGLLRPSMIELLQRMKVLKDNGDIKAIVVYSNNGNLALLHLAGKVLEILADAPDLFCNYIHWYHPLRQSEVQYGRPGMALKTFAVLKKAFQTGSCSPSEIPEDQIYFFDDINPPHYDLAQHLDDHYIQIEPYKYDADIDPLTECLQSALQTTGLLENKEYWDYIAPAVGNQRSLQAVLNLIQQDKTGFRRKLLKPNNSALAQQTQKLFPKPVSKQNFIKALQTVRKFEQKQNRGIGLQEDEQQQLATAKQTVTVYEQQHPNSGGSRKRSKTKKQRRRG